jgi:hypothetical protein
MDGARAAARCADPLITFVVIFVTAHERHSSKSSDQTGPGMPRAPSHQRRDRRHQALDCDAEILNTGSDVECQ